MNNGGKELYVPSGVFLTTDVGVAWEHLKTELCKAPFEFHKMSAKRRDGRFLGLRWDFVRILTGVEREEVVCQGGKWNEEPEATTGFEHWFTRLYKTLYGLMMAQNRKVIHNQDGGVVGWLRSYARKAGEDWDAFCDDYILAERRADDAEVKVSVGDTQTGAVKRKNQRENPKKKGKEVMANAKRDLLTLECKRLSVSKDRDLEHPYLSVVMARAKRHARKKIDEFVHERERSFLVGMYEPKFKGVGFPTMTLLYVCFKSDEGLYVVPVLYLPYSKLNGQRTYSTLTGQENGFFLILGGLAAGYVLTSLTSVKKLVMAMERMRFKRRYSNRGKKQPKTVKMTESYGDYVDSLGCDNDKVFFHPGEVGHFDKIYPEIYDLVEGLLASKGHVEANMDTVIDNLKAQDVNTPPVAVLKWKRSGKVALSRECEELMNTFQTEVYPHADCLLNTGMRVCMDALRELWKSQLDESERENVISRKERRLKEAVERAQANGEVIELDECDATDEAKPMDTFDEDDVTDEVKPMDTFDDDEVVVKEQPPANVSEEGDVVGKVLGTTGEESSQSQEGPASSSVTDPKDALRKGRCAAFAISLTAQKERGMTVEEVARVLYSVDEFDHRDVVMYLRTEWPEEDIASLLGYLACVNVG